MGTLTGICIVHNGTNSNKKFVFDTVLYHFNELHHSLPKYIESSSFAMFRKLPHGSVLNIVHRQRKWCYEVDLPPIGLFSRWKTNIWRSLEAWKRISVNNPSFAYCIMILCNQMIFFSPWYSLIQVNVPFAISSTLLESNLAVSSSNVGLRTLEHSVV